MRATMMDGAGDVRVETVPDAGLVEPTDGALAVKRAAAEIAALEGPYVPHRIVGRQ